MKFQRLISLCCLLAFMTVFTPAGAQAAAPAIKYYGTVTREWTNKTINIVLQCEVPSSMQLTESEEEIYKVGYGEGFDYGYDRCKAEITESLAQEDLTPPNATQAFAQYKTDTFSILLPVTWTVGTRSSYQQSNQDLERYFADSFISSPETALMGLTPWYDPFQITQANDFSYDPSWAAFTSDEIQSALQMFSFFQQNAVDVENIAISDMDFYSLQCPQATFIIQTSTMQGPDADETIYLFVAYLLNDLGVSSALRDFYFNYLSDYPFTNEDIAQFEDILRSIHFYE